MANQAIRRTFGERRTLFFKLLEARAASPLPPSKPQLAGGPVQRWAIMKELVDTVNTAFDHIEAAWGDEPKEIPCPELSDEAYYGNPTPHASAVAALAASREKFPPHQLGEGYPALEDPAELAASSPEAEGVWSNQTGAAALCRCPCLCTQPTALGHCVRCDAGVHLVGGPEGRGA